jgi:hypothetical protein
MNYVSTIVQDEAVQNQILAQEALMSEAIEIALPIIMEGNMEEVHENLDLFMEGAEDLSDVHSNIAEFNQDDMEEYMEAVAMVLADQDLSLEEKEDIIAGGIIDYVEEMKVKSRSSGQKAARQKQVDSGLRKTEAFGGDPKIRKPGSGATRTGQAKITAKRSTVGTAYRLAKSGFKKGGLRGAASNIGRMIKNRYNKSRLQQTASTIGSAGQQAKETVKNSFNTTGNFIRSKMGKSGTPATEKSL